jgi:CRISPR-associated protein Cst2
MEIPDMNKCLFATVLTYPAPSANYRGESEENRSIIQKITDGRFDYPIISPEAMRNALRELLRAYKLPSNRERLNNEDQLAVKFAEYPDPTRFADDFFMGYFLALDKKERAEAEKTRGKGYPVKRDSLLRMNLAKSLRPYRHNAVFTQSPVNVDSPWKNADTSALLHRETVDSAFQYPFAFNLLDVFGDHLTGPNEKTRKQWFAAMLRAIAELTDVAGNHARSLFHMAPASVVIRLTDRMVPGFNSYGFHVDEKGTVSLTEVIDGIMGGDYPGGEFYLGGVIVKQMPDADRAALEGKDVRLFRMGDQALAAASKDTTGIDFLASK